MECLKKLTSHLHFNNPKIDYTPINQDMMEILSNNTKGKDK